MAQTATLPKTLKINAWTGSGAPEGDIAQSHTQWAVRRYAVPERKLAPPSLDWKNWSDPGVGWGLVLPYRTGKTAAQLATADDAPESIRELVAARKAPVYRYKPRTNQPPQYLRDYRHGNGKSIAITSDVWGTQAGQIPRYLLLYGTPEELPWELQYALNSSFFVGRLDLTDGPLQNYVKALLSGFKDAGAKQLQTVVWAVDHGAKDITRLMRNSIAFKVYAAFCEDPDPNFRAGALFLDGLKSEASNDALIDALEKKSPELIVTTSHGMTGPLDDPPTMLSNLGLPVDQAFDTLIPAALLKRWQPGGAIWYAHACCSAGSDKNSSFIDIVDANSDAAKVLGAVAALRSQVAPLPNALLGAENPLRAFIGHVEPTFDWTLIQEETGQYLTRGICRALYDGLFGDPPRPVGLALEGIYGRLASLWNEQDMAIQHHSIPLALSSRLAARDVRSTVLLGDPTAILPRP